jgi:hypothetical protein
LFQGVWTDAAGRDLCRRTAGLNRPDSLPI